MALTVLSVAYPLAPVSPDCVGGAEQILAAIDRELVARGHRSIVLAQEGSCVSGELLSVPAPDGVIDDHARLAAQARHRVALTGAVDRILPDVVHLHGIDFDSYLPPPGPPTLATLHLPPDWYPARALAPARPRTWLNCVSTSQHAACPPGPHLLPPIANGINLQAFSGRHAKRGFALVLGRICPEKGVHLALRAAHAAGIALIVAGQVYPYREHLDYFEREVRPLLDARRRYVGPLDLRRKRRVLAAAACLLVPSLAPETSSLVAREALASGTPVIAYANGALPDAIEHGLTGFFVDDVSAMAAALRDVGRLDPEACRAAARARFSDRPMLAAYLERYERLARGAP